MKPDQTPVHGFRTRLALENEMDLVRTVRRQAYEDVIARSGAEDAITDEYDAMPHCRTYLLVAADGGFAGAVRASVYSAEFAWRELPLQRYHPAEMTRISARREPVVQSSLLGIVPQYRKLGLLPTLSIMRAIWGTALAFGADQIVTLVDPRPAKARFWSRIGWRPSGPPVRHRFADGVVLLVGSIAESMQLASELPEFRPLVTFARPVVRTGQFPGEV